MDVLSIKTSVADPGAGLASMKYYNPYHPRFWAQIKHVLAEGSPLLVRLYPGRHYPMDDGDLFRVVDREGHVAILIGYDDTTQEVILLDPWDSQAWGGTRGGLVYLPYDVFPCLLVDSTYDLVIFPNPWKIKILLPFNIETGDPVKIQATITYPCPEPFSAPNLVAAPCVAALYLPEGLELLESEQAQVLMEELAPGESKVVEWTVRQCAPVDGTITVRARGLVSNSDPYRYTDIIGIRAEVKVRASMYTSAHEKETAIETVATGC